MLYKLEVENFYSIRDLQVLDLSVDGKVPDPDGRFAPIFNGADVRVPKVVALYGANASGKTTVLRALEFVVTMSATVFNAPYRALPAASASTILIRPTARFGLQSSWAAC